MGRVLLVDDVASVRRALSLFLERAGHRSVCAESGEAALALIDAMLATIAGGIWLTSISPSVGVRCDVTDERVVRMY